MSRWHPDARGRLEQAAYELFLERGYEATTVVDIATRAGLSERTFFRHYADKREVLFGGAALLQVALLKALDEQPPALPTIEAVGNAVQAVSRLMHGRRDLSRERQRVVSAHPDLRERELIKRSTLTSALADALERRGVPQPAASLAADMGLAVFYVGFGRWLDDPAGREFVDIVREGFDQLKAIASGT